MEPYADAKLMLGCLIKGKMKITALEIPSFRTGADKSREKSIKYFNIGKVLLIFILFYFMKPLLI